ncbi:MAG TPA: aminotransferase class V-fold PLP-dependent enzyme [Gammaproteobacteria bacterium]|nr:aminotransferase class V-fold PLP-dependent enzyme [Gammaproteobacteria bacterium]HIN59456.1 aminotransferase class V-fold PLP-dependent enzyme [Gammaproteobacteria bacterium]
MSFARGRELVLTPGPSVMPDRVLRAMQRPAPNIYEGELVEITDSILRDLGRLAGTAGETALYVSNGHGVWEAALSNLFGPGDAILALASGTFGHGWADTGRVMGLDVEVLDFGRHAPVDPTALGERLKEDTAHHIKGILVVHADTSSSVRNDVSRLRQAIDDVGHPALLLVDCIASFCCDVYEMDDWGVDVTVTACQKGLMTPPGLAYVMFNGKAAAIARANPVRSPYWNWSPRTQPERFYERFCGTAPTHLLYAQREALDMIAEEGRAAIFKRHALLARAVWAAVVAWSSDGPLRCNIVDPEFRSHAVTTILADAHDMLQLRRWCEDEAGLILGLGLGFLVPEFMEGKSVFRIGHMGHLNPPMLLGALATIDSGLKALDIPHGPGALEAAAMVTATIS